MNVVTMRSRSIVRPLLAALLVGVAILAWPQPAGADSHCSFVVDPAASQVRGSDITVQGSFVDYSGEFGVYLTDGWDGNVFNPIGEPLVL